MKMVIKLVLATGLLMLPPRDQVRAQSSDNLVGRAVHQCTFTRACNWGSHALIAFGATYALHELELPIAAAAGTAALLYVGKEVRDHLRWGVIGSADSNGDILSGWAGALIAYYMIKHSLRDSLTGVSVQLGERPSLTVRLRAP